MISESRTHPRLDGVMACKYALPQAARRISGARVSTAIANVLNGKVAVISGGTSGIGARTAEVFVAAGARVVIGGRREAEGNRLVERLGAAASFMRADVSVEKDVAALVNHAVEKYGRLDCMMNNAGGPSHSARIVDVDVAEFDAGLAVHLRGVLLGMKYAAPIMRRIGAGSIINTASINGSRAGMTALTYSTAKAAVIHLTRCAAVELGQDGIRVNSLSPGPIITGIFGKGMGLSHEIADRDAERVRSAFEKLLPDLQPLRHIGKPDDIAQAALFLASDASRMMTGHDLVVDGGILAGEPLAALDVARKVFSATFTAANS